MTITEQMQQKDCFTETERMIIQFLLQNSKRLEGVTIQEIAKETYSSNASIIRLCRKLGYKGFREFKVAFVREQESSKFVVNQVDYSQPFQPQTSTLEIVNSMYSLYRESMDLMQSQLDIAELEKMVTYLLNAERIFLFGIGDAKVALRGLMSKLLKIGCFPILATENIEEGNISKYITSRDCALFVTYSGSYASYSYCAKILKKNRVPMLLLTANTNSEIYRYSTCRICVPDRESDNKIAVFYSQIVFEYLLNLIYSLMYRENKKK